MSDRNINAINSAAEYCRERGVPVVFVDGWESRSGTRAGRDTTPEVIYWHHTGGDSTSVSFLRDGDPQRGLGCLANFAVKQDGTVVVIAAKYANTEGYGNRAAHDELANNAPMDREVHPGPDSPIFSANSHAFGIEVIDRGDAFTAEAYHATAVLSAGLIVALGLNQSQPPVGGHKEFTGRKDDPWHDMAQVRRDVRDLLAGSTAPVPGPAYVPVPVAPPVAPPVEVRPTFSSPGLVVDGNFGGKTIAALQRCLREKHGAVGWDGKPIAIDGVLGRNTWAALQRVLNSQGGAGLTVDGIFGDFSKAALQRYLLVRADGAIGPITIKALQTRLNDNTF